MGEWNNLSDNQKKAAQQLFEDFLTLDDLWSILGSERGEHQERRASFSDLYAYFTGQKPILEPTLRDALKNDKKLQADFDYLLRSQTSYCLPQAAAASSGALDERQGDGFRIRIKQSRGDPDQIYVLIELEDTSAELPRALFLYHGAGKCERFDLPDGEAGVIQIVVEEGSNIIVGLREAKCEVFLR